MLITLNVTQDVADVLVSSYSSILTDRADQCDTIGHCRTVWNIIWSCLITIFACIWVAVHPNIPQPKPTFIRAPFEGPLPKKTSWAWVSFQASTLRRYLTNLVRRQLPSVLTAFGEKLAIALLALLAPEFIFVWALRQWLRARSIAEECREAATTDSARDWRKQRRAENAPAIAKERAEFEDLEALGYEKRTGAQDERHEILRKRTQAAGKESEGQPAIEEDGDQTSQSILHAFCEIPLTFYI